MKLAVIILNYRTPELTIQCLGSLAACVGEVPGTRVLVVDNNSGDESVGRISAAIEAGAWSGWASLLALDRNYGFAGGNNRGIERIGAEAEYVLLLNSDTIVPSGVLRRCVDVMEGEPRIGLMSCLLRNGDGSVQNAVRRFPSPLRQLAGAFGLTWSFPRAFAWADLEDRGWDRLSSKRDVEWIGGAFMLIRRRAIAQCGVLDESFFFYGEDIEYCHRLGRAGWRCHYDPGVSITHLGGASSDPTRLKARQRTTFHWTARYLIQQKCYGRAAAMLLRVADVMAYALRWVKMSLTGRRGSDEFRRTCDVLGMLVRRLPAGRT
jgi:GT2 family glycosyltransferase